MEDGRYYEFLTQLFIEMNIEDDEKLQDKFERDYYPYILSRDIPQKLKEEMLKQYRFRR